MLEEKIDKDVISNSETNSSAFEVCDSNSETMKQEQPTDDDGDGSNDSVFLSKEVKKEKFEENDESQAEELQLKNEELDIKEEDR